MVRSVMLGIALMFSFLAVTSVATVASADAVPSNRTRRAAPVQCACFRSPCDCEKIERALDRRQGLEPALTNCSGGDFHPAHTGTKPVCYYENVYCDAYKENSEDRVRMKGIKAYCLPNRKSECPSADDEMDDCVNSNDVTAAEFKKLTLDTARTGDKTTCEDETAPANPPARNPNTRSTAPARRNN